jgi:predicted nucleic acid-binding protein
MKIMLDTNIIVDILSKRDGYEESLQLIKCCEVRVIDGFITVSSVMDIMYILRKHIDPRHVRETVQTLLLVVDVASVHKSDITSAFLSKIKDYEDAVQSICAERMKADYIVTRNIKDYAQSVVPAILPSHALSIISRMA